VHETLSDEKKRKYYDQTGEVGDISNEFATAYDYWRNIFPKISVQDIEQFKKTYVNSEMEEEDVRKAYQQHPKDLYKILMSVPFSDRSSISRLVQVMNSKCGAKFTAAQEAKASHKIEKEEAEEAEEAQEAIKAMGEEGKVLNDSSLDGLTAIIQKRQAGRANLFDSLAAKYSQLDKAENPKRSNKKRTQQLSDEDFARFQSEMFDRSKKPKGKDTNSQKGNGKNKSAFKGK